MKSAFYIIAACLLLAATAAHAEDRMTVNGVQYATTSGQTATACLTVKAIGDIEIAEKIRIKGKMYTTTEIGKAYFGKNEYLQSVVIPNSVKRIRKKAFAGCTNLVSVHIPKENCQVEPEAFAGCTAITLISTDDNQLYPVDYVLAAMPKDIPYYVTPQPTSPARDDKVGEILSDLEYDVDYKIPVTKQENKNTFAFIIGNEDYSLGGSANVDFAVNDARVFREYCLNTLGIPEGNVKCYTNQTLGLMRRAIRLMKQTAIANKDKKDCTILFYYSGHGIPDEDTKTAYLVPTDADGKYTEDCYSLNALYTELGSLPVRKVFVFLDACFSGSQRGDGMLMAARGLALAPKEEKPLGDNMVIFSAATGAETAYPYKERKHGMFTYYLLNMLYRTKGACNIGELGEYVGKKVAEKSVLVNSKKQTPTLTSSIRGEWKNLTLR